MNTFYFQVNVSDFVSIVSHTSHPHVMSDGTVYNLAMSVSLKGPAYCIIKFSPSTFTNGNNIFYELKNFTFYLNGFNTSLFIADTKSKKRKLSMFEQAKVISTIPSRWILNPSYMHTFGMTENYFIIIEQPLSIGIVPLITCKIKNEPMNSCFKWFENENVSKI